MNQKKAKAIRSLAFEEIRKHGLPSGFYRWCKKQYLKIPRKERYLALRAFGRVF